MNNIHLPESVSIVGCAGFVGSHLLERLLAAGVRVEGWDLDSHRISHLLAHPLFQFHQQDYSSPEVTERIASAHPVVIHLAALCNPSLYNTEDERVIVSNYHQPALLAEACARAQSHLIFFSTSEVYGKTIDGVAQQQKRVLTGESSLLSEQSSPLILGATDVRRWSYACAKQLMERYLIALGHGRGLAWTVVRPFNFLGPRMDFIPGLDGEGIPRVMACFMDALLHGRPLQIVDQGVSKRAFTWIGDAVEAVVQILGKLPEVRSQCFNVGNPANEISVLELAQLMILQYATLTHKILAEPPLQFVTAMQFYGEGYEDSDRRLPDISKITAMVGWIPQKNLEDTVRETMRWYIEHYKVNA